MLVCAWGKCVCVYLCVHICTHTGVYALLKGYFLCLCGQSTLLVFLNLEITRLTCLLRSILPFLPPVYLDSGQEVVNFWWAGRCGVDREHEHGAGWQQEALSDEWGDHSDVTANESDFRTHGSGSCFSCHRKFAVLASVCGARNFPKCFFSLSSFSFKSDVFVHSIVGAICDPERTGLSPHEPWQI